MPGTEQREEIDAAVSSATQGMETVMVPMEDLQLDPRNARKGNIAAIVESLREFGQHRPIVARRENGQIIIGNHMYKAARTLGWTEVAVVYVDDTEEQAVRRGIADNAVGDKATWNQELLGELLGEVGSVPGFDDKDVSALLKSLQPEQANENDPIYPIVARPNEEYDYVLIVAKNATDVAYIRTKFDLRKEKSYKSSAVGLSHVVSVERLQELWGT